MQPDPTALVAEKELIRESRNIAKAEVLDAEAESPEARPEVLEEVGPGGRR